MLTNEENSGIRDKIRSRCDSCSSSPRKQRESFGSFDCIGMNTISYSRYNRENQQMSHNPLSATNSAMYLSRYDRHWSNVDFPPPPPTRFSNKLILVIDCSNLKIVHLNDRAARVLFNCESFEPNQNVSSLDQIVSSRYVEWLKNAIESCQRGLGAVIVATSDLVNIVDSHGTEITVSAFVQKLTRPLSHKCLSLFAFERCHRFLTSCCLNRDGIMLSFDSNLEALFGLSVNKGCQISSLLNNINAHDLLQLEIGEEMFVTGNDKLRNKFPVTIVRRQVGDHNEDQENLDTHWKLKQQFLNLELQLYTSISGLVVIDQNGTIVDCNSTFIRIFLGHKDPQLTVLQKNIRSLIPAYYELINTNKNSFCDPFHSDCILNGTSSDINDTISAARLTHSLSKDIFTNNNSPPIHSPPVKRRRNNFDTQIENISPLKSATCLEREVVLRQASRAIQFSSNNRLSPYQRSPILTSAPVGVSIDHRNNRNEDVPIPMAVVSTPPSVVATSTSPNGQTNLPYGHHRCRYIDTVAVNGGGTAAIMQPVDCGYSKCFMTDGSLPGNGHYHCQCLHFDGNLLESECLVSQVESHKWALWICRAYKDPHTIGLYLDSMIKDNCFNSSSILRPMNSTTLSDGCCSQDDGTTISGYFAKYEAYVELQAGRLGPIFLSRRKGSSSDDSSKRRYVTKLFNKSEMKPYDMAPVTDRLNVRADSSGHFMPREYQILSTISHPNIIQCIDAFEDLHFYQLVYEHRGMDVVNFLALNPDMDEHLCSYLFQQLVQALCFLHNQDIVHRNIHAENILIDTKFQVTLIDFSYARSGDCVDLPFVGPLDYCPPEIIYGQGFIGKPGDIWSMGVSLFMLMFGFLPFKEPYSIIRNIRLLPNLTSELMSELFSDMFCPLPQTRITADLLLVHPWVVQPVDINLYKWEDVVKRGDAQTHINFQDFQQRRLHDHRHDQTSDKCCSSEEGVTSNPLDALHPQQEAYAGCSPIVERGRRRDSYSFNSVLNRTIHGDDTDDLLMDEMDENACTSDLFDHHSDSEEENELKDRSNEQLLHRPHQNVQSLQRGSSHHMKPATTTTSTSSCSSKICSQSESVKDFMRSLSEYLKSIGNISGNDQADDDDTAEPYNKEVNSIDFKECSFVNESAAAAARGADNPTITEHFTMIAPDGMNRINERHNDGNSACLIETSTTSQSNECDTSSSKENDSFVEISD